MSNKNKGKNKRTSSVSVDQSAAKKKKNAPTPASTPSKTRQNQVVEKTTIPELSSDDSLSDLINNLPAATANTSATLGKDDNDKPIELPHFTFDDMNKLLDNVKKAIPDNDILKFNTRLEKLDWEKVKFDNFSADDCRKLVIYAISFTRKFKTLSEILSDAKLSATKPNSKIYRQSNKDSSKPRHPSSSYMIFANEIRDKLRKQNPTMSIIEIGKLIGEKWRQLPDNKKEKYVKKFEENKKVYLEEISKYNIEHNHQPITQKKKELDKPRTPLSIYLSEKLEKDDNPDLEGKTLKEKQNYYKTKYNQLSDKKKFKYIKKCMDAEEQFVEKLKDKLKTSNVDYKTVLNKNERDIVEKMNGKPENPAANGYALFIKENITKPEIANVEPKQRNQLLASKWKELSKNEKDDYNSRAKSIQEKFVNDLQIYAKNLPEKEAIELYMSNTIPSFAKEILQKRIESFAK